MEERNEIVYGDGFWRDVDKLPKEAQEKLPEIFEILTKNVFDSRLHTKPLGPSSYREILISHHARLARGFSF